MNCPNCGAALYQGDTVCRVCGRAVSAPVPVSSAQQGYSPEYKPLSPWAYVGYSILFSIPVVGFILLIVFALDSSSINRRNYARSFFCMLLIGIIISIIVAILAVVLGASLEDIYYDIF